MPKKERTGLISLVDDLVQDPHIRARFNRSPMKLANEYDLDASQRAALFRMQPEDIGRAIALDLSKYSAAIDPSEWPREAPEYYPLPGETEPSYPKPTPWAFRFSPLKLKLPSGGAATTFELTVFGQSFMQGNTKVEIRPDVGGGANLTVVGDPLMFGTFRCSGLRCVVTFPAAAGDYQVWVLSPATPELPLFPNPYDFRASQKKLKFET